MNMRPPAYALSASTGCGNNVGMPFTNGRSGVWQSMHRPAIDDR